MRILVVLLFMIKGATLFELDNVILGEPKLECNPGGVTFSFNTRKPFEGTIYVRGYYDSSGCRQRFDSPNHSGASISIRLGDCGMRRSRQISPRGVNQHITFVANFHPLFTTKEVRTFNVRCFYAHTDTVVKTDLEVSQMPEDSVQQSVAIVPKCTYSLRQDTVDGPQVTNTRVGNTIVHRWDCDTNGNYGMLLRKCSILDSHGDHSVPLLDEKGCSVSRDFPEVIYQPSLTTAYMAIEAISFPDQPSISFTCEIKLCDKGSNECQGMSPPTACSNPSNRIPFSGIIPPMPFDNTIGNSFDGIPYEPWMKEPSPPIDETNSTTTTVPPGEPMPRLITEEEQYQIESNHVEGREKRFAHRLINVTSENLFVEPSEETFEIETPGAPKEYSGAKPCISIETFYISAFAVLFVFVVSIGLVCYFGSHVLLKKSSEDSGLRYPVPEGYYMSKL